MQCRALFAYVLEGIHVPTLETPTAIVDMLAVCCEIRVDRSAQAESLRGFWRWAVSPCFSV